MIIIPMAGGSSRFYNAGYTKPKYMLKAHGISLFEHAIMSFERYFNSEQFLFIIRDVDNTAEFIQIHIKNLGIQHSRIFVLKELTRGQAETVAISLKNIDYNGPITIFNIDTFRPHFKFPDLKKLGDGYLEIFKGTGNNWSFVRPINNHSTIVAETAEKNPISNLCSTGLYHFSDSNSFLHAYDEYLNTPNKDWVNGEIYIAPLYNLLIKKGLEIHYHEIKPGDVIFCGIVEEYLDFCN